MWWPGVGAAGAAVVMVVVVAMDRFDGGVVEALPVAAAVATAKNHDNTSVRVYLVAAFVPALRRFVVGQRAVGWLRCVAQSLRRPGEAPPLHDCARLSTGARRRPFPILVPSTCASLAPRYSTGNSARAWSSDRSITLAKGAYLEVG